MRNAKDIAPPDHRGEGPLNSRGNILIPVLIAFAVVSSLYVVSTVLMNNSTAIHNRIRIGDDIDIAMKDLKAQLLTPGLCFESFRNSDGSVVTWNPATKIVIDNIRFNSATFWKIGDKISPTVTLKNMELRQPDNVTYPGEPNQSFNTISRRSDNDSASPLVNYNSYLAKLIVTFDSQGLGGARKSRSIYINVQTLGGTIEYCYPTTGGVDTNNNSFLNEMGTICNLSNSRGAETPAPATCSDPTCTSFVVTGFNADGSPNCACACVKDVIVGNPLNCYTGFTSSGTWICTN